MKNQPTYDDANLILRLYELRREEKMREARKWMGAAPQFASREEWLELCPPGSEENAYYRMVTTYWEMAATFVATGILNRELFYRANNMELLFVWEKVRLIVPKMREVANNPLSLKNTEDVAQGFIAYLNEQAPGFHETWAANIAKMGRKT
jgi:hypothetical protein